MADTVTEERPEAVSAATSTYRAWASAAGSKLGAVDRADGIFDDTPPSGVRPEQMEAYQMAYWLENPGYAVP